VINTTEIANGRWTLPAALDAELASSPERFTPWFKLEWHALRHTHGERLRHLLATRSA
jgi:isopentenyl-diphosphate delta-isomerase